LTIEQMFDDMHDIVASVRLDDLTRTAALFEAGSASAEMCDRYAHLNPNARPKVADKKKFESWQRKVSESLKSPSQIQEQDRTPIVWIVDSVTYMPSGAEPIVPSPGRPTISPNIALCARVWSTMFRTCGFMDNRVAVLHIAQMRTAGIGAGRQAYKK